MLTFDNSYARLPERFYARVAPTRVAGPRLVKVNHALSELLGVDARLLESPLGVEVLSGNRVSEGAAPLAQAYAGHQFGGFVPQLGDGRAILLGEVIARDGRRRDIQLKGAGPTPYSRRGDGRAALGPVLREYVVSEAMAKLGVPTTRALAAVTTGEAVLRERPLPGAVLTRVATSHLRVGTFQFFAHRRDEEALGILVEHALARHYPDAEATDTPALALLECVIGAQARLVAKWLGVGFVHGVMNTDNTSISGETLDYGPCAFLDEYARQKVFSSIDHGGRYAFGNQPRIAHWNLSRLAEALLPRIAAEPTEAVRLATARLEQFGSQFERAYLDVMQKKLGLSATEPEDRDRIESLLGHLADQRVDYTLFFRRLASALEPASEAALLQLFSADPRPITAWLEGFRRRLEREPSVREVRARLLRENPAYIPRNHRIEQAIQAAISEDDFGPFERLVQVLASPYDEKPEHADLAEPPREEERVTTTFCGT